MCNLKLINIKCTHNQFGEGRDDFFKNFAIKKVS